MGRSKLGENERTSWYLCDADAYNIFYDIGMSWSPHKIENIYLFHSRIIIILLMQFPFKFNAWAYNGACQ